MNLSLVSVEKLLNASHMVDLHLEVQDRIREAAMVLWRSPKTAEERYLSSGNRCSWPSYVRDWHGYGYERARMPKIPPQPKEIDRMEETLDWIAWLATQDGTEATCVWQTFALRRSMAVTGRRVGMNRNYVSKRVKAGIQRIVDRFLMQRRAA